MAPAPGVHVEVAGTDGAAGDGRRSGPRAATAVLCASLRMADCASTAIVTLNAQTHGSFDLPELTRAGAAAAREGASRLGARGHAEHV